MNYWIHRISHVAELSYPLLDKGYLTIGFSDFTGNEIIDKALAKDWSYFNKQFREKWKTVPRTKHNLWRFFKMSKGDIVIVPSRGTFFVCEITSDRPLLIGETFSEGLKSWGDKSISTDGKHLTRFIHPLVLFS